MQSKTIICIIIACQLVLFLSGVRPVLSGGECHLMQRPFAAPASEVGEIMAGWFSGRGYAVRRDIPYPGYVQLTAWKAEEEWIITVRPRSALASVATVAHEAALDANQTCRSLSNYVEGYLLGSSAAPRAQAYRQPPAIPTVVLDAIDAVVCIKARSGSQEVQFSGFVIDPEGLVLCTAHDLSGQQQITVTFADGTITTGIVTRLDRRRDMALVECRTSKRAFVSLSDGRNMLRNGERVYSIGCPNDRQGTPAPGIINAPPRLSQGLPLWQVGMDIFPGSSGSPVFDARGRLVAMVKGRYRGTSRVGFLTPLETIMAFLFDSSTE